MYIPGHFEQSDRQALYGLIGDHPLATLIVNTDDGLTVNHIPLLLDTADPEAIRLRGHIARANPLSMTQRTPSMVRDVSATFVATTTLGRS